MSTQRVLAAAVLLAAAQAAFAQSWPATAVKLNAEILKAIESGDVKERLRAMGSETPTVRTPEAFTAFVAFEVKTYGELVKRSGAKID